MTELETLTNGLIYPLTGDAPYKTFCWLLKEKGEFTLEKFLFDVKAIKISNCRDFLNNVREYSSDLIFKRYINLIKRLEGIFAILHVYHYFDIPIMFGYTSSGELIGLAPERVYSTRKDLDTVLIYPEQIQANQTTSVLVREIKTIIDKLPYNFGDTACPERLFWTVKVLSNRKYIIPGMMIDTVLAYLAC
ncbi:nuclease A inhibitor family protein [Dulcicalothrix desertica]|uniref:nuclease A inhibitor family protein n=2 Tax=Dulcicalothrix desertica TaxID=32056 RepID=UPI0016450334|nr:nuclease A inhibitor family protein [Dulcicalothrix desertica]